MQSTHLRRSVTAEPLPTTCVLHDVHFMNGADSAKLWSTSGVAATRGRLS